LNDRILRDALTHYERSTDVDLGFEVASCSWNEVLESLRKAQNAADKHSGEGASKTKKVWRKLSRIVPIIVPALQAIPDDLGVLHGGLGVIFHVSSFIIT